MSSRPLGLQTETVESAMRRADSVSRPDGKSYSGTMCRNKDLRHVVLMVHECRRLRADLAAAQSLRAAAEGEVERLRALVEKVRCVATGEDQVAEDDSEGMGYITHLIIGNGREHAR